MRGVGRRRTRNLGLPAGVREIAGIWYWNPTSGRERDERRRLKAAAEAKGQSFTIGCTLGPAGSVEARRRWAEVSGYRDPSKAEGTVAELCEQWRREGITTMPNGIKRADSTISMYRRDLKKVEILWGACRYAKTAKDAADGIALGTAMIQTFVSEHPHYGMANRLFAVLDNVFAHAVRRGRTTYNPCEAVVKNAPRPRGRVPLVWEVECLEALAGARMFLQMDLERISGWRIGDILALKRQHGTAEGIKMRTQKGKKWQLWDWTPGLRRIWAKAEELPFATKFPNSPIFPSRKRGALSWNQFNKEWNRLKAAANALLAAGVVDVETLAILPGLSIEDLDFHDLRSKAHDDAEDSGRAGHGLLGNTKRVSDVHYARRPKRMQALE